MTKTTRKDLAEFEAKRHAGYNRVVQGGIAAAGSGAAGAGGRESASRPGAGPRQPEGRVGEHGQHPSATKADEAGADGAAVGQTAEGMDGIEAGRLGRRAFGGALAAVGLAWPGGASLLIAPGAARAQPAPAPSRRGGSGALRLLYW